MLEAFIQKTASLQYMHKSLNKGRIEFRKKPRWWIVPSRETAFQSHQDSPVGNLCRTIPINRRAEGEGTLFQPVKLVLQLYIAFSRRVSVYIFYRKKTVQADGNTSVWVCIQFVEKSFPPLKLKGKKADFKVLWAAGYLGTRWYLAYFFFHKPHLVLPFTLYVFSFLYRTFQMCFKTLSTDHFFQ